MAKKKSTPKKGPAISITDPVTQKSASLNDPQAVRAVLIDLVTRLGITGAKVDESDPSEMVAVEILANSSESVVRAGKLIRDAESLAEIFAGTSLADVAADTSTKGDRPMKQIPLPKGKDLELTKGDAGEVIDELWGTFRNQVERTAGEQSQTIGLTITWHPPTGNRDGYVGVHANTTVKSRKRTRTGTVTKKGRGKTATHQFNLFAEEGDDE
jgi:hypothetical protein